MSPTPYDVLVIGGGPAGLAAGAEAASGGLSVAIVDERPTPGGQIFKQPGVGFRITKARKLGRDFGRGRALLEEVERSGAELLLETSALSVHGTSVVVVTEGGHAREVEAQRLVVAAGAHDRPVVFPGWTLPGVITAGGAQALVKTQRVLPGRSIVFAGSGPLALAFPAQLRGYGANVTLVLEAGPAPGLSDLIRLARTARGNTALLRDALGYRARLLRERVPLRYRRIVVRAEGDGRVEQVVHAAADGAWRPLAGTEETVTADTLCVGSGFFPSVELLRLAGCDFTYDESLGGPVAVRDAWMRTTVAGISAAGDGTGVAGSYVAVDEGRLAGLGALLDLGVIAVDDASSRAGAIRDRLRRKEAFRQALSPLHAVGAGVYELDLPDTVVCRCEEVRAGEIAEAVEATRDVNLVKSLTRAGMGLCQGRSRQRQVAAMIARRHGGQIADLPVATPRPPLRPVPMVAVADASVVDGGFFTVAD
jgi:NADPH-dependent 2,4-dienoyl-CoA reductase/sulfur reductase-like enzyme